MGKTYSTVHFPLSTVDPAAIDEGLIPNVESTGQGTSKTYIGIDAIKFNLRNILFYLTIMIPKNKLVGLGLF